MQPLYFLITTAGTDTAASVTRCISRQRISSKSENTTQRSILLFTVEYWTDPKVWKKANPSLDKTIGMDKVVAACNSAKETPGEENAFRQLRLNQWVKQAVRWMPMENGINARLLLMRMNFFSAFKSDSIAINIFYFRKTLF